jgi:hypothetical protein
MGKIMAITEVAQVDVQSAWLSKINWGEIVKVGAALLATKGVNLPADVQNDILLAIVGLGGVYTFVTKTWFTKTITPASAAGDDVPTKMVAKILIAAFLVSAFLVPGAKAADFSTKAISNSLSAGYPLAKCGVYYGFGTGGSAGAVDGAVVGTQIVQGELDALVGYTCPFAASGFWFVEGSVGFDNINGSVNGLALSGPLVLMQRAGAGSPINGLFNPFGANLSMPSLPALPNGVTAGPANGYFFAGLVEQDISAQVGLDAHSHQWVIAPMIGAGLLTRLSDGVVVDTWAGWQMNSQSFCPGGGGSCAKLGNAGRVGVSFKY